MASKRKVLEQDSPSKRQKKEMPLEASESEGSASKLGKELLELLKQLFQAIECGRKALSELGPCNGEKVHLTFERLHTQMLALPATILPEPATMPDKGIKALMDVWIKKVALDKEPDSRNLSLVALESCARHFWPYCGQYAVELRDALVLAVQRASSGEGAAKPSEEDCAAVAALLAALKVALDVALSNNFSFEASQEQSLREVLLNCVPLYSTSSLLLSRLCQLLLFCPTLLPPDSHSKKQLNLELINAVAFLPRTNVQTIEHMVNIGQLIYYVWEQTSTQQILDTLKAIYATIANKSSVDHLSPALAHLLTLVPDMIVANLAPHIRTMPSANSPHHFKNTLSRLSVWLVVWPAARETLLLWLRTLVEVMVRHNMAVIVEEVVVDVLPKLSMPMRMPALRASLLEAATLLLLSCQHSASAYQKCFLVLASWSDLLRGEDLTSPQPIHKRYAELCHSLITHFPDCEKQNLRLLEALKGFPEPTQASVEGLLVTHDWSAAPETVVRGVGGGNSGVAVAGKLASLAVVVDGASGGADEKLYVPTQGELPNSAVSVRPGMPAGLENIGSTCYYNAIMQALYATDTFRHRVLASSEVVSEAHRHLRELFSLLLFTELESVRPSKHMVSTAAPDYFEPGQQHDASEFMGYLLDTLKESELKCYKEVQIRLREHKSKQMQQLMQMQERRAKQKKLDAVKQVLTDSLESLSSREVLSGGGEPFLPGLQATVRAASAVWDTRGYDASVSSSSVASSAGALRRTDNGLEVTDVGASGDCDTPTTLAEISCRSSTVGVVESSTPKLCVRNGNTGVSTSIGGHNESDQRCGQNSGAIIPLTFGPNNSSSFKEENLSSSAGNCSSFVTGFNSSAPSLVREDPSCSSEVIPVSSRFLNSSSNQALPEDDDETMNFQAALLESYRSSISADSSTGATCEVDPPPSPPVPGRPLKRKGTASMEDDSLQPDPQKSARDDAVHFQLSDDGGGVEGSASITTITAGDIGSDDNSDSGISIQDDIANSNLDSASTAGGSTEEEDMEDETVEQQHNDTLPLPHSSKEYETVPTDMEEDTQFRDAHALHDDTLPTIVESTFGGKTVRLTHCLNCRTITENYDSSIDLKVSFEDCSRKVSDLASLDDMIRHSLKKQELVGSEQYFCEVCNSKRDAEIHTAIVKAPNFLILAQNRFIYNSETRQESKILTPVDFHETLELPVWDLGTLKENISSTICASTTEGSENIGSTICASTTEGSYYTSRHESGSNSSETTTSPSLYPATTATSCSSAADSGASTADLQDREPSSSLPYKTQRLTINRPHSEPNQLATESQEEQSCSDQDSGVPYSSNDTESRLVDDSTSADHELATSKVESYLEHVKENERADGTSSGRDSNVMASASTSTLDPNSRLNGYATASVDIDAKDNVDVRGNISERYFGTESASFRERSTPVRKMVFGSMSNFDIQQQPQSEMTCNLDTPPDTPEKPTHQIPAAAVAASASPVTREEGNRVPTLTQQPDTDTTIGEVVKEKGDASANEKCPELSLKVPSNFSSPASMNSSDASEIRDDRTKKPEGLVIPMDLSEDVLTVDDSLGSDVRESSRLASSSGLEECWRSSLLGDCSPPETNVTSSTDGTAPLASLSSVHNKGFSSLEGCSSSVNIDAIAHERYALYAIVVHSGTISRAGHYYCYVRSSSGAVRSSLAQAESSSMFRSSCDWVELNDSKASSTSFSTLKTSLTRSTADCSPYLMFYQKVPQDHQPLDLSPTRQEEQFNALAPQLQDVVRSHVHHHRKRGTRTSGGVTITRGGGASGSAGGASGGGAGGGGGAAATGCGGGGLISAVRFIC